MKALLLAAGYATRLYPLTIDKPKPLLPVSGRPVLEFILDMVNPLEEIDTIFVVTNDKFHNDFKEWKKGYKSPKRIAIVNDGTKTNQDRLGGTGDIEFVVKKERIEEDLIVIAGDNLFKSDLRKFINFSISKRPSISLGLHDVRDLGLAKKYGIVSLDEDNKVTEFVEKPANPRSTLAAMCLYFFPKDNLRAIEEYLESETPKDAPGYFLEWLYKKEPVFGYVFKDKKWFDIGDNKSYEDAKRAFTKSV
jgi:glucose-1-phosphate thymidylyltransferase